MSAVGLLPTLTAEAPASFRSSFDALPEIEELAASHPEVVELSIIGTSEEGRPVHGIVLGNGPLSVSLIAGAHADEPVGPETLRSLVLGSLRRADEFEELFHEVQFVIVPHVNPDGEARNWPWAAHWPDLGNYLNRRVREKPGRDLEFGFPAMRKENKAVASFLREHAPYSLHMSLHGMGFSDGALLLIERHWSFRTEALQRTFAAAAREAGLRLHDHNRKGEKGFFYIGPGFSTTPEGEAMRTFFRARGDWAMTGQFHDSSMEFVRSIGGDPLCMVTELPLFVINHTDEEQPPGKPVRYLAFRDRLAEIEASRKGDEDGLDERAVAELEEEFGLTPLPLETAIRLQLQTLRHGLQTVMDK